MKKKQNHSFCYCKGKVRICDDSATNLSREMYCEFCKPYNEMALAALGGGWIHTCGSVHHYFEDALTTKGITGMNFGNPERYHLPDIYREISKRNLLVNLFTLNNEMPKNYPQISTGIIYHTHATSFKHAEELLQQCIVV